MIDRRIALLGLPAGALSLYFAGGLLTSSQIEFTRPAAQAPAALELRPAVSTAFLDLPIDLARVARRTEAALAQRLALQLDQVSQNSDPACARRPATADCAAVKLDGSVSQTGAVEVEANGAAIKVKVPVRIDATKADAAAPPDRSALDVVLAFQFAVRPSESGGFEVVRREDTPPEGLSAGTTSSQMRAIRQLEARLRPVALGAHDELRQVLNSLPVATATQQAWAALSQPFELGTGSGMWLRPIPELVGTGQLVSSSQSATQSQSAIGKRASFRIPIAARLSIDEAGRGTPSPKRPVIQGQILTETGTNIRIAQPLSLNAMETAANNALVKGGAFDIRPDRFGPPVKIEIRHTKVYPSVRQLAFELDLTATRYEGESFRGKAHLIGRPHLDATTGIVTLADITLTSPPGRDSNAAKVPQNAPRLAAETIAAKLSPVARFDVTRDLAEATPRFSGLLHLRLGDRLIMSARIDRATPVGVETSRDGAWLLADLTGALTLTYEGPGESIVALGEPAHALDPKTQTARRTTTPEIAAAAVVSATAAAAAAQSMKQAPPTAANTAASTTVTQTVSSSAGGAPSFAAATRPVTAPIQSASQSTSQTAASSPVTKISAAPAAAPASTKAPARPPSAQLASAQKQAPATVKTKVLAAKPTKVAANKSSWVPFAQ